MTGLPVFFLSCTMGGPLIIALGPMHTPRGAASPGVQLKRLRTASTKTLNGATVQTIVKLKVIRTICT